jgi:L-aminopeptidase/D-esterase-like protein
MNETSQNPQEKNTVTTTPLHFVTGEATPIPAGFLIGNAQDLKAGTGCTVISCPSGAVAGMAVRGGAPATRESDVLRPENTVKAIHAVMLSGGSAFGLDAAAGAMRWLAEQSAGFALAGQHVPVVCGASLFDLTVGDGTIRPDADMGYAACKAASGVISCGNIGAGTGASVGKLLGDSFAMKSGLGAAGIEIDGLIVSALVAVNALGNIRDRQTGGWLAGVRDPADQLSILDPYQALLMGFTSQASQEPDPTTVTNTTLACIVCNGLLNKTDMTRIASMAHDGLARAIAPVHTSFDGDVVFALSRGEAPASADLIGILAGLAVEAAIDNALRCAVGAYGLPAANDVSAI